MPHIMFNRKLWGSDIIVKQFLWRCVFSAVFVGLMLVFYKEHNTALFLLLSASSFRASCVIAVLFAVASLGVFPPLSLIYMLCGAVLPFYHGMMLCIIGSALVYSFSYFLGRYRSKPMVTKITHGGFLAAFMLRAVRIIPCKTVGIYMGKAGVPFRGYFFGSISGSIPSIAVSLVLGSTLK